MHVSEPSNQLEICTEGDGEMLTATELGQKSLQLDLLLMFSRSNIIQVKKKIGILWSTFLVVKGVRSDGMAFIGLQE